MSASPETREAGPMLDTTVAERVMQWPRIGDNDSFSRFVDRGGVLLTSGPEIFSRGVLPHPWRPSTDISAAFTVVEKMRERGWHVAIGETIGDKLWSTTFWDYGRAENQQEFYRSAPTLPHAICLSALAALANSDSSLPSPEAPSAETTE